MTQERTICLRGGHVWPGAESPIVEGGVLVRGNKIEAVLAPDEVEAAALTADEVIDATGTLIMPPLVSAHVHSTSTLLRGTENSLPLELWSYYAINYGRGFVTDAVRSAVMLTNVEMIRGGVGAYVDHFPHSRFAQVGLEAHIASGLRIAFAPFFADLLDENILDIPLDRDVLAQIAPLAPRAVRDIRAGYTSIEEKVRSTGDGRITLLAGPNSAQRCSDELWSLWKELQDTFGVGSHTHLLETLPQAQAARRRWPSGVVRALDETGLLHDRVSVGHGIWLDPAERDLLAARGVTVSYNPVSNGMLGSGRKTVRTDLDAGINIALGTDCSNTGGKHDLFEVMRHMLISGRDPGTDFERWVTPLEALQAATTAGARAICSPSAKGRLAAGDAADILLLDLNAAGMAATAPTFNSLVVHADARNVRSLMVDGRWLLRNGAITVFDEQAVLAEASRLAADLRATGMPRLPDIGALHGPYADWQRGTFKRSACPTCGSVHLADFASVPK